MATPVIKTHPQEIDALMGRHALCVDHLQSDYPEPLRLGLKYADAVGELGHAAQWAARVALDLPHGAERQSLARLCDHISDVLDRLASS